MILIGKNSQLAQGKLGNIEEKKQESDSSFFTEDPSQSSKQILKTDSLRAETEESMRKKEMLSTFG